MLQQLYLVCPSAMLCMRFHPTNGFWESYLCLFYKGGVCAYWTLQTSNLLAPLRSESHASTSKHGKRPSGGVLLAVSGAT